MHTNKGGWLTFALKLTSCEAGAGEGFEIICKRYDRSSPAITMRYLRIEDKEVHGVLMNEIG